VGATLVLALWALEWAWHPGFKSVSQILGGNFPWEFLESLQSNNRGIFEPVQFFRKWVMEQDWEIRIFQS